MADIESRLFAAGIIVPGDYRFHGGDQANHHVDMELVANNPELEDELVDEMTELVKAYSPDVLVGIPDGGTDWAQRVSDRARLQTALLEKRPRPDGSNDFEFTSSRERDRVQRMGRLVIIDDVATRLSTLERVLQTPEILPKAVGFVAILNRGRPTDQRELRIARSYVVERYIPPILPADSPLW